MPSASVSVVGEATDLPFGDKTVGPVAMTIDPCISAEQQVTLPSGNTTVTKPSGASVVLITFPSDSSVTKTIRGVAGDVGINVGATGFVVLPLNTSVTSFVINCPAADTGVTTIMFL